MSRGFVKEDDLEHAGTDLPERPLSPHPNYVTANGLLQLQQQETELTRQRISLNKHQDSPTTMQRLTAINRDLRYVQARLNSAILVQDNSDTSIVHFGVSVDVEDEHGELWSFQIVGEDEADISLHKISYVSPLAKVLLGHKVGDSVLWVRPLGALELTIVNIEVNLAQY